MMPASASQIDTSHGKSPNPAFFRFMFPVLRPWAEGVDEAAALASLRKLAAAMLDQSSGSSSGDNPDIPAGFTYLGQFIDHDITFDPTSIPSRPVRPEDVRNFRTPGLDLDSVYGLGPGLQPYLYQRNDRAKLRLGRTSLQPGGGDSTIPTGLPNDLPRLGEAPESLETAGGNAARTDAIIGDKRNDENLIVAQTHLLFLKFHNAVVDELRNRGEAPDDEFAAARRSVTWHYQWIVLNDFVRRIVDPEIFRQHRQLPSSQTIDPNRAVIPVEFSVAAYRMGHSMVRDVYDFNRVFRNGGVTPASLSLLFRFSGLTGNSVPIPSDWIIDWRRFYNLGNTVPVNASRRINPLIAPTLHGALRDGPLPELNLKRGFRMNLPSGQDVASALGLEPLSPESIASGADGEVAARHDMHRSTPLWYYILKEAQLLGGPAERGAIDGGRRLGPVGSKIVCRTFFGLLDSDPHSFRRAQTPWSPDLPRRAADDFTMVDLIEFVGDINPIGDDRAGD